MPSPDKDADADEQAPGSEATAPEPGNPDDDAPAPPSASENIRNVGPARTLSRLQASARIRHLQVQALERYNELRDTYGRGTLALLSAQLIFVNAIFLLYFLRYGLKPPEAVMKVWIVSTFVEIVGIALVVTRSLYPKDGGPLEKALAHQEESERGAGDDRKSA